MTENITSLNNNITGQDQDICIYDYRCDVESAIPKNIQVFRGEAVKIIASLYDNNQKQTFSTGTVSFYWQTKEMEEENLWWTKSASINSDGDIEVIFDSKTQDNGSNSYTWFLGIETESGLNTRAHGLIFMQHGIGIPNELPLPIKRIDFATIEVVNPPWIPLISAEASARISADNELSGNIDNLTTSLSNHVNDTTIHVTSAEKIAISSISSISSDLSSHTNNSSIHVTSAEKNTWNNKVSRNGDLNMSGYYRVVNGSIETIGIMPPSGHIQPMAASLGGGYGDITIVGLEEDKTHTTPPENLKLWQTNIYADRIERFDGDTGEGSITHRFPSADGTFALVSEIPVISGKADKVANAISGDIAILNSNGNLQDSGYKPSSFAKTTDLPGFETWTFEVDISGTTQTVTKNVAIYPIA